MARADAGSRSCRPGADRRLTNRLAAAKLRFPDASIEDIDFAGKRGLDRRHILQLAQGAWLQAKENLIVTGQTGTGKTWLACAFARQAARLDYSVLYLRVPRLFENLALARLDGRFPRLVDKLARGRHTVAGEQPQSRGGECDRVFCLLRQTSIYARVWRAR